MSCQSRSRRTIPHTPGASVFVAMIGFDDGNVPKVPSVPEAPKVRALDHSTPGTLGTLEAPPGTLAAPIVFRRPRRPDQGVHVLEVLLERSAPCRGQPILGARRTACKRLLAVHVAGIFQPSRVNAEVAVRRAGDVLQIGERERFAGGKRRENREPRAV